MNKRAWAMTAPLVVLVALLVASCGDDSPTDTSSASPPSTDGVPSMTQVGSGLTSAAESPLAGDRPPIVVPTTVLVQRPPEAWGEGR